MTEPGSTPALPPAAPRPAAAQDSFRELQLVGVRVEIPANSPLVLLKEAHGDRYLPIRIGSPEATAIAFAQQGMVTKRPLTHDLFRDVLKAVDIRLLSVRITRVTAEIFYADLVLSNGSIVSTRPSDGIALAVRTGASVFASDEVLAQKGVDLGDDPGMAQAVAADAVKAQPSSTDQTAPITHISDRAIPEPATLLMTEMKVAGVRVEVPSNSPIVLLKEAHGDRYLPIWIGAVEATAIAFAQQGMVSLRPLTHDLLSDVLNAVDIRLLSVRITSLTDGMFYSDLVLSDGSIVKARPSDGIALAVRAGATIEVTTQMIEELGREIPDEQTLAAD
jgi:bifunctional DNase/RNase